MEKKVEISILLEIYGKLLTDKQYGYMNDYYNEDLSLSEIAENEGITRQAVMRILQKTSRKLEEYEEKLQIMDKQKQIKQYLKSNKLDEIEKLLDI